MLSNMFDETLYNNSPSYDAYGTIINKPLSLKSFISVYLSIMGNIDKDTAKVLIYIMENSDENNIFHGNYDELVKELYMSRPKLAKCMALLQEIKYIEKVSSGWKVLLDIQIPKENGTIVIQFKNSNIGDEQTNNLTRIDFDKYSEFVKEYATSYVRINKNNMRDIAPEYSLDNRKAEIKNLINEYKSNNENKEFSDFVKSKNLKDKELDKFLSNSIDKYINKFSRTSKKYKADFCSSDINQVKSLYKKAISNIDYLSGNIKFLLIAAFVNAINDVVQFYKLPPTYNNIKAYITKEMTSASQQIQEYISALFILIEDENEIISYED